VGVFPLDDEGKEFVFKAGAYQDGKDMPFDVKRVTEDVKFSWFADSTSGKPFTKGENVLEVDKKGAYSFVKAPLYNGKPMEVGPLARMWVNNKPISPIGQKLFKEYFGLDVKNFRDMGEDLAFSLLGRHVARAEESYLMLDVVERFLKEVRPDEETFSMPVMKDSEGFGFTEAPRGSLMHFTKVRNGKIDNYQIVSATLWNCAPRNDTGMRGALEEALIGVPVPDIENPVNIARLIRAFDP
jgi:hydrogenase large subunit